MQPISEVKQDQVWKDIKIGFGRIYLSLRVSSKFELAVKFEVVRSLLALGLIQHYCHLIKERIDLLLSFGLSLLSFATAQFNNLRGNFCVKSCIFQNKCW